jgi:hypothetical protein
VLRAAAERARMSATLTSGLKVDGGVFTDLARVPELAGALERQGYDACWTQGP